MFKFYNYGQQFNEDAAAINDLHLNHTNMNNNLANVKHIHAWLLICINLLSLICIIFILHKK